MAKGTIFERYGGFATAGKIVMTFYDRILDSDITGPYFDDVEMPRLIDHQTKFVASVMGGPASYTDEALKQLHSRLNVTNDAFDEMARLFRGTLEDFAMAREDIEALMKEINSRRGVIVSGEQ